MVQFRRIVCAIDFSPTATAAAAHAAELARVHGGELTLLFVLPHVTQPFAGLGVLDSFTQLHGELRTRAKSQLDAAAERLGPGLRVRTELREGNIADEVVAYARDTQADLLVIGTHGYTGVQHLLLGSTAERVVRRAACPVLTVRTPK
jgi:nucleotide-binding universal stress UspA family protein